MGQKKRIAELQAQIKDLEERIETLEKRPYTPFTFTQIPPPATNVPTYFSRYAN